MKINLAFLLGVGSLFIYNESHASAMCKIVPSCESLGYTMKASECSTISSMFPTLKCPFDNSIVFCPDDCQTYPIIGDSCDASKGRCVRCATTNRWKYLDCNEGYVLLNGECKPTICDKDVYIYNDSNKPDAKKGTIISCKNSGETRYGYSSCNEGWTLAGADCVEFDCGEDYVVLSECPDRAECRDTCMSGDTEKTQIKCNEGLILQEWPSESGDFRCVKNKIGSIYEYNDVPIGVVFDDDGYTTKIIALQDIDKDGQVNDSAYMRWIAQVSGSDIKCELAEFDGAGSRDTDSDGFKNTEEILDFANYKKDENSIPRCWAYAAKAAYRYSPEVCEEDSFCRAGKWYLPSEAELKTLFNEYKKGEGTLVYDALHNIEKGVTPFPGACKNIYNYYDGYWSSNWSAVGPVYCIGEAVDFSSGNAHVRPVLAF